MDRRIAKRKNQAVTQVLIHWKGLSPANATWEFADEITTCFPDFKLEDKVVLIGEDLSHAANTNITGHDEQALTGDEERARTEG
jgi:CHASE2 domain-containing sensor protein